MNELIFSEILIADMKEKTARKHIFKKGINIITSNDNHVGKSSLIKSLYYTMGADVRFDDTWNKYTKIYSLKFELKNNQYQIVRYMNKFSLIENNELIFTTDSISCELATKLEEIFDFGIYLPTKNTKTVELAPPVFIYMPYYIDQDLGWSKIYESFERIQQYDRKSRLQSLYYHLGIYNKDTIELTAKRDKLKLEFTELELEQNNITNSLELLSEEASNIIPADNIEELERNLQLPKKNIENIVKEIGEKRNKIQEYESLLQNHKFQLAIIEKNTKVKTRDEKIIYNEILCPNCGYTINSEIFEIVQKMHTAFSRKYAKEQVVLMVNRIEEQLSKMKTDYIELLKKLKKEEQVYNQDKDSFDSYIRQKGLERTIISLNEKYEKNSLKGNKITDEIKTINKELKVLVDKEKVEEKYKEILIKNLLQLDAWEQSYEDEIKILAPLEAQGTLRNKIILAQEISLFETMEELQISVNKYPFVIDSPRGNEASELSSEEILKMIINLDYMPQIILGTVDFEKYKNKMKLTGDMNELLLTEKYKLLNEENYTINELEINELKDLMQI